MSLSNHSCSFSILPCGLVLGVGVGVGVGVGKYPPLSYRDILEINLLYKWYGIIINQSSRLSHCPQGEQGKATSLTTPLPEGYKRIFQPWLLKTNPLWSQLNRSSSCLIQNQRGPSQPILANLAGRSLALMPCVLSYRQCSLSIPCYIASE